VSSDIMAFIEARLAEDQTAADSVKLGLAPVDDPLIAAFTPDRVRREVASKRAALTALADADEEIADYEARATNGMQFDWEPDTVAERYSYRDGLRAATELLASAWSDHPDYRKEWAP
jgi:Family of unknown function (DUF6221)